MRTLQARQDTLGRLHDLQILQHHVAAVAAAPRGAPPTPDAGLAILSRPIEDECRHLHGRYVSQLPALLEAVRDGASRRAARLTVASRDAIGADGEDGAAAARRAASGQR